MAPHVGLSLVVNHVLSTSLSWSLGSLYLVLKQSKMPTSTRSWTPRLYHLAQHGKVSLRTVARSAMPKGAPEVVDVKKEILIQNTGDSEHGLKVARPVGQGQLM